MRKIKWVLLAIILILVVGIAVLVMTARRWEREAIQRLASESTLVDTRVGVIEYVEVGEGPAILTIHGAPGGYGVGAEGEMWADLGYRYISLSRPGYLRTPLSTGRTPEEQADAFAALLDELGIEKATLIAGSGGGPYALQFALRHPDRCGGMVLISAVMQRRPPLTDVERRVIDVESSAVGSWLMMTLITQKPEWIFPALDAELEPTGDPHQYDRYIDISMGVLPAGIRREGWINDMEQASQMPLYPLEEITCPTLLVHGTEDTNVTIDNAEFAAETIPNAEFVRIEGGTHLVLLTHEADIQPQIIDFIARNARD